MRVIEPVLTEYDRRLGQLLAMHRMRQGLTQKDLAAAVGCSFQQIQKYECAGNRMAVSRLYEICKFLQIPMGQFLQEADAPYVHDAKKMRIIQNLDKMAPDQVKLILQLTNGLVGTKA